MKTGLMEFGQVPSVFNIVQDEKLLAEAFKRTEDNERSQNESIANEIEFMRMFIDSAKEDPTFTEDEGF